MENTKERNTAAYATLTQETLREVGRSAMVRAQRCCEANGHLFEHELEHRLEQRCKLHLGKFTKTEKKCFKEQLLM